MNTLPTETPRCDVVGREPSDAGFVGNLSGLDDLDGDEVISDAHQTTTSISDDDEPTTIISNDHEITTTCSDERAALEARILDSCAPIATLIEQEVTHLSKQVEREASLIDPDEVTIDGFNARESLRGQVRTLRLRLEHAVMCPWPVRPAHRESKLPAWQRLRVLEVVSGLRSCQVKRLRGLSMQLGDLDFWLDLPRCATGETRCACWRCLGEPVDARWPVTLKAALWKRWREVRSGGVPQISRDAPRHASAQRSGVDAPGPLTPDGRMPPCGVTRSVPTNLRDTCADDEIEVRDSVTVGLPVALLDRRAELGDHALHVLALLALPKHKDFDADGWRPLSYRLLERVLGEHRVQQADGTSKKVKRVSELLGAPARPNRPARPGLLESLGLTERRSGYLAGEHGWCQRYRLVDQSLRSAARETVELVLRERKGASLPTRERCEGPAVDAWLASSYPCLRLDRWAAMTDLCERAGIENSNDPAAISAAIAALPSPTLVLTKARRARLMKLRVEQAVLSVGAAGVEHEDQQRKLSDVAARIDAMQPPDPRIGWQAELAALDAWALPDSATRHELRRDGNVGRLWSPLTALNRHARRYLTIDGRPAVALDLRCAGLVLQAGEMRRTGATSDPDCAAWVELVEREDAYEALFELQRGRKPSADEREAIKVACRTVIYGSLADQHRSALGKAVQARYPGFFTWLVDQKRQHGHRELACQVLRLETAIVLEALPPAMQSAGIKLATIHDAIVVADVDADRAKTIFEDVLRAAGVRGVVR